MSLRNKFAVINASSLHLILFTISELISCAFMQIFNELQAYLHVYCII